MYWIFLGEAAYVGGSKRFARQLLWILLETNWKQLVSPIRKAKEGK